jgi:hypothetical protein
MIKTNTDILTNFHTSSLPLSRNWESIRGQILQWKQPNRLHKKYHLHSQDHILGTLLYDKNYFIPRATATTADKEWKFKYTRFSLPEVSIKKENDLVAKATIETNWGWHGTLIFTDGIRYTWKSNDVDEREFSFFSPKDHPVVFIKPHIGFFKVEAEVELDVAISHSPHKPLLTMLGWFLVLLRLC